MKRSDKTLTLPHTDMAYLSNMVGMEERYWNHVLMDPKMVHEWENAKYRLSRILPIKNALVATVTSDTLPIPKEPVGDTKEIIKSIQDVLKEDMHWDVV